MIKASLPRRAANEETRIRTRAGPFSKSAAPAAARAQRRGTASRSRSTSSSRVVRPNEKRRVRADVPGGEAGREEDRARLRRPGRAGRARRGRDPLEVEGGEQDLPVDAGARRPR